MNRSLLLVGALVILAAGGYFLYQNSNKTNKVVDQTVSQTPSPQATMAPESTDSGNPTTSGTVKEFTITSSGPSYDVKEIKVKQGDKVRLTFVNKLGTHNIVIDELSVRFDPIAAGQSKTVEFTADKKGTFKYYCSVANHRQLGQEGTLVVE